MSTPNPLYNPDTLELIFEQIKDAPSRQHARVDAIDGKAVQVFSAASVILGVAGVGLGDQVRPGLVLSFFSASIIAYLWTVVAAFNAFKPRKWRANEYVGWLWERNFNRTPDELRHIIVADLPEIVEHNEHLLLVKVAWIKQALFSVAFEVLLVSAALLAAHL